MQLIAGPGRLLSSAAVLGAVLLLQTPALAEHGGAAAVVIDRAARPPLEQVVAG